MKNKRWKKFAYSLLTILLLFLGVDNFSDLDSLNFLDESNQNEEALVEAEQSYHSLQEVVNYLDQYKELPPNYLTKEEAKELGWEANEGNLWDVAPKASIGGDYFGNFEGLLPEETNRDYYEADINYNGGYRGSERLIFSNDGLYFYTEDHYESFEEIEPGGE